MKEARKYKPKSQVPEPTLKRLPGYLYYLEQMKE
jgi:redox-sensing transcriptional repressor